jgi:DNA-binding transcriptional MerR regulator
MSNLAVQTPSLYSEETAFIEKPSPVAPTDGKGAKKAQGAFRTISEVADELDVPQHVLRFWETKFNQVKPLKRGGGRRYYRPEDVALLKHIHHLLYTEGYTIKGVQKLLKGQGKNQIAAQVAAGEQAETLAAKAQSAPQSSPHAQAQTPTPTPTQASAPKTQPIAEVQGQISMPQAAPVVTAKVYNLSDRQRAALEDMLAELKALRALFPEQIAS